MDSWTIKLEKEKQKENLLKHYQQIQLGIATTTRKRNGRELKRTFPEANQLVLEK